jgi:hypothetical protein
LGNPGARKSEQQGSQGETGGDLHFAQLESSGLEGMT